MEWAIYGKRFCNDFRLYLGSYSENWILEQLIEGRRIDDILFNESELSLFYHQIKMISHKLDFEIGRADLAGLFHEEL